MQTNSKLFGANIGVMPNRYPQRTDLIRLSRWPMEVVSQSFYRADQQVEAQKAHPVEGRFQKAAQM